MRYTKKPVTIEAVRFQNGKVDENPDWLHKAVQDVPWGEPGSVVKDFRENTLAIHTLEGVMKASDGDYIVQGVQGELYPCKPEIFEATYEKAPETFVDRVEREADELNEKIEALGKFLQTETFEALEETMRSLMHTQRDAMLRYHSALQDRLALLGR